MNCIAIITARGGSKRIPRKNIKDFCGKPIIAYPILAALESRVFEEVMVSTDDPEIAEISRGFGAAVPFMRSEATSDDKSNSTDAVIEVLLEYAKMGKKFDYVSCIYPTAPFITAEKLKNASKRIEALGADSLIPVIPFSYPPQRGFVIRNEKLSFLHPEYTFTRSQDLETMYHDVGQFYFAKVDRLLEYKSFIMPNLVPLVVPEEESQDIDNESDWKLAELKYKHFVTKEI